jgi:hypothetical protein
MATNDSNYVIKQAFPAYRVFIFGKEVTDDVISVDTSWHDGPTPSTCTITLVSPEDKYTITHEDIVRIVTQRSGTDGAASTVDKSLKSAVNSISTGAAALDVENTKWDKSTGVIAAKLACPMVSMPPDSINQLANGAPQSEDFIDRFPFQSGKPIFHPMDPVRVAFRDPFDPATWYWMFSGFVSDFNNSFGANQDKTLMIVAESPAKLLRYARFTANSGIVDISKLLVRTAIVADIATKSAYANLFVDMSLQQVFYALIFGVEALSKDQIQKAGLNLDLSQSTVTELLSCANGSAYVTKPVGGVGHPDMAGSRIFIYGPQDEINNALSEGEAFPPNIPINRAPITLDQYQSIISHKVVYSDVDDMKNSEASSISGAQPQPAFTIDDVITIVGSRPDLYPVDGGRLFIMLPSSIGTNQRAVITRDFMSGSFALNTEWGTRSEVLHEIVQRAEFVFYVSPRGDWIVEFPMYDFSPSDYGSHEADFTVLLEDTCSVNDSFSDSKVYTQAVTSVTPISGYDSFTNVGREIGQQGVVTLWHLIPFYGVRNAPITARGYISTKEASVLYSHIALNRLNADAHTQGVSMNPRAQAWLNRPMLMHACDHIGTVKSITNNITWGASGTCDTSVTLNALRGWDGETETVGNVVQKVYTTIGGRGSRPLNYKMLLDPPPKLSPPIKGKLLSSGLRSSH